MFTWVLGYTGVSMITFRPGTCVVDGQCIYACEAGNVTRMWVQAAAWKADRAQLVSDRDGYKGQVETLRDKVWRLFKKAVFPLL